MRMSFISLLLLFSCSSYRGHAEIKNFVEEYSAQYQSKDPKSENYIARYEEYLESVNAIFQESKNPEKFDKYLSSLRENGKIIVDTKGNLKKGPSSDKTKVITNLSDVLNDKRIQGLRRDLDRQTLVKLLENNERFNHAGKEDGIMFPL
jgi:hypothetical protein